MPDSRIKNIQDLPLDQALERSFASYPDFPRKGVNFRDICPILADPQLMSRVVQAASDHARKCNAQAIIGIESRGFLVGVPSALNLGLPFIPARKKGKLPGELLRAEYALEYGTDTVELQRSGIVADGRYLVVDDVLATGGTAQAVGSCVQQGGGRVVGYSFILEIAPLGGNALLAKSSPNIPVFSMLRI
jgi:adenine phosphoribosyltransferase